jgi:hypothetical protein
LKYQEQPDKRRTGRAVTGVEMAHQETAHPLRTGGVARGVARDTGPEISVRLVGALLALAVATVHVADQGGITVLNSPHWIGWGYRAIEVGGVLTAITVLLARPAWLGWAAGVLLGAGPLVGYLASRSIGVPGDHPDVGNWGDWVGTVSLFVEAALIVLSVSVLLARRRRGGAG